MPRRLQALITSLAVVALLVGSAPSARAESEYSNDRSPAMVDAVLLRPLGLAMVVVGTALCVPVCGFTLLTSPRDIDKPFTALVINPGRFTFGERLGSH